ncbi:hypothetical protein G7074_00020 [Pedobacter sp. HDW13]|uniref:hypothetical protein n=1 Tax=unclassified Pedobacter TaxID=2628915 RepID=UPI000F5AF0FD|nr:MULTISPECIES: hypothetical protein [unclassified Pedobacter]QIL37813.1 hypothetical protein G7074_00020 [Pedobacter sp. HDW13]RQO78974.1 hypothetical protein DBR40_04410 [Pedobacter sp. KBW01]
MKKITLYLSLAVALFLTVSCNKGREIGKWDDNIKLSQKTASFNSSNNSIVVTTETTGWWLNGISLNKTYVDLKNIEKTGQNFVVVQPDFKVERKDGNKIIITMSQNTTNSDRLLGIDLQNGNYFDGIQIAQSK